MLQISKSKYSAFLFDFDGTLVNTDNLHFQAYTKVLNSVGVDYVSYEEHVRKYVGLNSRAILEKVLQKHGKNIEGIDELVFMKKYIFTQLMMQQGVKVIDGAIEFLTSLRSAGKKIAMVSGGNYESVQKVMAFAGLTGYFDILISKEMIRNPKPDPECYNLAMQRLSVESKDCIGFDNDELGLEALKNAGVEAVGLSIHDFEDQVRRHANEVKVITSYRDVVLV